MSGKRNDERDETTMGTTHKGTLATLEEFRSWIAGCDLVIAGRVRARASFLRRDEVEKFIDRINAAADRDRRAMQCAWEPGSVASIVRQMEDDATDLRNTDPRVAENLRYYADQLKATHAAKTGNDANRSLPG